MPYTASAERGSRRRGAGSVLGLAGRSKMDWQFSLGPAHARQPKSRPDVGIKIDATKKAIREIRLTTFDNDDDFPVAMAALDAFIVFGI